MMNMERRRIERMEVNRQVNLPPESPLNNISMEKSKQVGSMKISLIEDGAAAAQNRGSISSPPPLQPSANDSFDFLNLSWQSYPYLQAPYTFASDVIGNEFSVLNDFMTLGDDLHEPSFETSLNDPMGGLMQGTNYNNESSFGNPTNGSSLMPPHGADRSMMFDPNQPIAPSPNPNGNNGANREQEV